MHSLSYGQDASPWHCQIVDDGICVSAYVSSIEIRMRWPHLIGAYRPSSNLRRNTFALKLCEQLKCSQVIPHFCPDVH
ncbi:hypothetical protein X777_07452 [Ooceraea biroi]|uniref:Uncharacterized protein n=1 Tax=Ooceraea biroi TaxID=2015173 RepID=A0A026X3K0_OOCBI|nr:hypothetical protein X777_07452 [Ooceraea biroi]